MTVPTSTHRAQLVGCYHSRKAAGTPEQMAEWLSSLPRQDKAFIMRYMYFGARTGQWGNLDLVVDKSDLSSYLSVDFSAWLNSTEALKPNFEILQRASGAAYEAVRLFSIPMLAAFTNLGNLTAEGARAGIEQMILKAERRRLFLLLKRVAPAGIAQWLADRWPAALLPTIATSRYQMFKYRIGETILEWWRASWLRSTLRHSFYVLRSRPLDEYDRDEIVEALREHMEWFGVDLDEFDDDEIENGVMKFCDMLRQEARMN